MQHQGCLNLFGYCGPFIDKVIQKTVIDVNEEGVEAAAVTAIFISESSAALDPPDPILMMMDHPFQFFIYDSSEDLVLFEGRLGMPEVPATAPLLSMSHSEEDFWMSNFRSNVVEPPTMDTIGPGATGPDASGGVSAQLCGMSVLLSMCSAMLLV